MVSFISIIQEFKEREAKRIYRKAACESEWQPRDATFVRDLNSYVLEWIDAGARWIGGCCLTKPKDIERVREVVERFEQP